MVARRINGALALSPPLDASVVTLGTFDGVHLGHQELANRAVAEAKRLGVLAIAYTFDPNPATILAPHRAPPRLMSLDERVERLIDLGIDSVIVEVFDQPFASISADEWVQRFLVERLHPKHVVVGFNFNYGQGRQGNSAHLSGLGATHGFSVDVVRAVALDSETVSSSRIRQLILEGDVSTAQALLGRRFAITGTVVRGDQRGRTIGFPTANLKPIDQMLPASGVYAGITRLADGRMVPSVTNIGVRPTFDGARRLVETHLLDFSGDLYGQVLRVELIVRLRDERKFDGVDALVTQITEDVARAREHLRIAS